MHRKILTIALAVFALVLASSPALAAKAPHRYSPKHGAKCRKTYKRVKHGKKVYCVKQKAKAKKKAPIAAAPVVETKLHSHLDPTFTRDPLDPFKVTYAFSASATQETFSAPDVRLADTAAPLPSGVLSLFSDGKLECAVNVGGAATGSECPVIYPALGAHTVTTIYTSGEQSATETEVEMIEPLATTTTLSATYAAEAPVEAGVASDKIRVGELTIGSSATPQAMHPQLGCGDALTETLDAANCYQVGASTDYVYVESIGACIEGIYISKEDGNPGVPGGASEITGEELSPTAVESGGYHLRASVSAAGGYASSDATTPLQFSPAYEGEAPC